MEQLSLLQNVNDINKEIEDLNKFYFKGKDLIAYHTDEDGEIIPIKANFIMFIERKAFMDKKKKNKIVYILNCYWDYVNLENKIMEGYEDGIDNSSDFSSKEQAINTFYHEKDMFEFQKENNVLFDGHRYFHKFEIVDGKFVFKGRFI